MILRLLTALLLVMQASPLLAETEVIVMLGAPGAGKGTQASRISEATGLPHICVGDLFRDNIRRDTELGQKAKEYVESGHLTPNSLVMDMLFDRLSQEDCKDGYVLDGFPRSLEQAEAFEARMDSDTQLRVVALQVPDQFIADRITGRMSCSACQAPYHKTSHPPAKEGICDACGSQLTQRKDDTLEVLSTRLKTYHEQSEPVEAFYRKRKLVVDIDGCQSFEAVFQSIMKEIR